MFHLLLASVFTLTFVQLLNAEPLKICSFNVQIFGTTKAKDGDVMNVLGKVTSVTSLFDKLGTSAICPCPWGQVSLRAVKKDS